MFLIVTPDVWITANFKESRSAACAWGTRWPRRERHGNSVKIVQRIPVKIVIDRGSDPYRPLPIGLSVSPVVIAFRVLQGFFGGGLQLRILARRHRERVPRCGNRLLVGRQFGFERGRLRTRGNS